MREDKYAPKHDDNTKKVHELHLDLIKSEQEANKKAREDGHKPKPESAKPDEHSAHDANPTQPPAVESPQNPEAPQNKPVEHE